MLYRQDAHARAVTFGAVTDGASRVSLRRRVAACAAVAVAATAIAACGSDGGDGATSSTTAAAVTTTGDSSAPAETSGSTASTQPAVQGGTLVYGTYGETPTYDPLMTFDAPTVGTPNYAIYDTLMRLEDGKPVPYLAQSMETTDDGTTWVMTLREGVEFHDGEPFDAAAVVFNIERHIEGPSRSAAQVAAIESVEATGPLEVTFTLATPWAAFPAIFTVTPGFIASPTAIERFGEDYGRNPVGAGPFKVDSLIPDDRTVLVRNENYWQPGLPLLDSLIFRPIPDHQVRTQAVLSGDIDITYHLQAAEIAKARTGDVDVYFNAGNGGETFLINTSAAPFDDVRIRRALRHGLNDSLVDSVRFEGNMVPAQGPFAPESPWYVDVYGDYPGYDPAAGKALIAEYESETGTDVAIELKCPTSPDRVIFCELVQQMWTEELGVDVSVDFLEIGEYVQRLADGSFQVSVSIQPHFDDPDYLYDFYFSDSPGNQTSFANAEMDAALSAGRESGDPAVRAEAYAEVARVLADELPVIWYARSNQALIAQPYVTGVDHYSNMIVLFATLGRSD